VDGTDLLLVAGVVTLLLGVFATKLPMPLRTKRRWLVAGGVALLLVSAVIGWPHIIQGFKDGVSGR
jgi:hypothetical protein